MRWSRAADVHSQSLLSQSAVRHRDPEHLTELQALAGEQRPASEETAGGFGAGEHRGTDIPAPGGQQYVLGEDYRTSLIYVVSWFKLCLTSCRKELYVCMYIYKYI